MRETLRLIERIEFLTGETQELWVWTRHDPIQKLSNQSYGMTHYGAQYYTSNMKPE